MQWLLRFRVCIIICLAVVLITAAVGFSLLRAALPYATEYKNEIQAEISHQLGIPVEIESLAGDIDWFSPRLKLIGVTVFDRETHLILFQFEEAFIELDVLASLSRGELIVGDIGLVGIDLKVEKLADDAWRVQGFDISSEGKTALPEQLVYMIENADYLLHDSNIHYRDHLEPRFNMDLLDVNIEVQNSFNNHRIKLSMKLPQEYGRSLAVVADLRGAFKKLDGEFYVEAEAIRPGQWNRKFRFVQSHRLDAVMDVRIWGELQQNILQSLITELDARDVSITHRHSGMQWRSPALSGRARLLREGDYWNLSLADLRLAGSPDDAKPGLNLLASENRKYYHLSLDHIRLQDYYPLLDTLLKEREPDAYRQFRRYQVQAELYNLDLQIPRAAAAEPEPAAVIEAATAKPSVREGIRGRSGTRDSRQAALMVAEAMAPAGKTPVPKVDWPRLYRNKTRVSATVVDLAFALQKNDQQFSLAGLDFSLHYEKAQAQLRLLSENLQLTLPHLFEQPLRLDTVDGELQLSYQDEGWQLASESLQLQNAHINSFSRLQLRWQPEKPLFVDMQTDFYDGYGQYAVQYLPVGIMSPGLIDWLKMAVTDGYVPQGSFLLYGRPGDFPFHHRAGIFQVVFDAQDVNMQFLHDWPKLQNASARIRFENQSLELSGRAKSLGVALNASKVRIPHLPKPELFIDVEASAANDDVQDYVWRSALDETLGEPMRLFQLSGRSRIDLSLWIPFDHPEKLSIDGQAHLFDAGIDYPAMGYEMTAINGVANFTRDSVFAESIQARVDGQPVELNIHTRKKAGHPLVVYHLDGLLDADYLLQQYQWVPPSWVQGRSQWSIDIEVPRVKKDYLARIRAASSLRGVSLRASDKLTKTAAEAMDFRFDLSVMGADGLHLESRLNRGADDNTAEPVFNLYAQRDPEKIWHFTVNSHWLRGKGDFSEDLAHDTEVVLDMEKVDLHALFYSSRKSDGQSLRPSDFPSLRWQAKSLLWDDWHFRNVELETDWHQHGMLINRLEMDGPAMHFKARGSWLTSWTGAHETVLQGRINSSNCGKTLTGLGFERSLDRCKYMASFNAMWPAQPYAFNWGNLRGKTEFEMLNGEIMTVDPGAGGRLLGLLNIFKLANRLAFDFDDVTRKGFAFDKIKGEFKFDKGRGSLKNCDVYAPAANINIFGRIGLVDRDYGLLMRVKAHTDTLTLAGGTLLGGVVVGAGLAILQKALDIGVGTVYSITGSWDDPVIEKIVENSNDDEEEEDDF